MAFGLWIGYVAGTAGPVPGITLLSSSRPFVRKTASHEACEFRNYLLWVGVYPVKVGARD